MPFLEEAMSVERDEFAARGSYTNREGKMYLLLEEGISV
jgi:hypothetical protein